MLTAETVGLALLVVLETLTPTERVAYVLHDIFAVPFDERKLKAARKLEQPADRCEKVARGKLSQPNQFGYVDQVCEMTANTKPGPRGFILPPTSEIGNPSENTLLPGTVGELQNLGMKLREVMVDGGFMPTPNEHRPGGHDRRGAHHRPPRARLRTHPPPPTALPHRRRRPGQPPQMPLRRTPQPRQRRTVLTSSRAWCVTAEALR